MVVESLPLNFVLLLKHTNLGTTATIIGIPANKNSDLKGASVAFTDSVKSELIVHAAKWQIGYR